MQRYLADDRFQGDIVLIEPRERDAKFFAVNPMAFWKRREAVMHGFESVRMTVEQNYDQLQEVFESHGLRLDREAARRRANLVRSELGWEPSPTPQSESEEQRPLRLVGGQSG
jgi:hypothetical protein